MVLLLMVAAITFTPPAGMEAAVQAWSATATDPATGSTTYTLSNIPAGSAFDFVISPGQADEVTLSRAAGDAVADLTHVFMDSSPMRPWSIDGTLGGVTSTTISGTGLTDIVHTFEPNQDANTAAAALNAAINTDGQLFSSVTDNVITANYRTMNAATSLASATTIGNTFVATTPASGAPADSGARQAGMTLTQFRITLSENVSGTVTQLGTRDFTVNALSDSAADIQDDLLNEILALGNSIVPAGEPAWVRNGNTIETNSHRNYSLMISNNNAEGLNTDVTINDTIDTNTGHAPSAVSIVDPRTTSTVSFTLFSGEALADVISRIEAAIDTETENPNWTASITGSKVRYHSRCYRSSLHR